MQPVIARTPHDRANAIARLEEYISNARARAEGGINRIMSEIPTDRIIRASALSFEAVPSTLAAVDLPRERSTAQWTERKAKT